MSFNPEQFYLKRIGDVEKIKIKNWNVRFLKSETIFGRNPNADVITKSIRCSKNHCKITFEDGRIFVEDLNSSAGIFVNNERIHNAKRELFEGVTLGIGADPNRPEHFEDPVQSLYQVYKVGAPIDLDSIEESDELSKTNDNMSLENETTEDIATQVKDRLTTNENEHSEPAALTSVKEMNGIPQEHEGQYSKDAESSHELLAENYLKTNSEDLLQEIEAPRKTENIMWRDGKAIVKAVKKRRKSTKTQRRKSKTARLECRAPNVADLVVKSEAVSTENQENIQKATEHLRHSKDNNNNRSFESKSSVKNINGNNSKYCESLMKNDDKIKDFDPMPEAYNSRSSSSSSYKSTNSKVLSPQNYKSDSGGSEDDLNPSKTLAFPGSRTPSPEPLTSTNYNEKFPNLYQSLNPSTAPQTISKPTRQRRKSVFEEQAELIPEKSSFNERNAAIRHWKQQTTQLIEHIPQQNPETRRRGRPKKSREESLGTEKQKKESGK